MINFPEDEMDAVPLTEDWNSRVYLVSAISMACKTICRNNGWRKSFITSSRSKIDPKSFTVFTAACTLRTRTIAALAADIRRFIRAKIAEPSKDSVTVNSIWRMHLLSLNKAIDGYVKLKGAELDGLDLE